MSGRHEPLADALRGHQQPVGAEPDADVAVVRRGVAARVHAAADLDDVGAKRGFGAHAVRARILVAAGRRSRSSTLARSVDQRDGALGEDEGAADRIAHHLHAARGRCRAPARRRAGHPFDDAVDEPPDRAGHEHDEQDRAGSAREHHAPGFCAAAAGVARMRRLETCRARAWRPGPSGLSGASWMTCCHACGAPSRSCLPNALTMPTFSSVLACFGSILSEWSNCSSALSGWFV